VRWELPLQDNTISVLRNWPEDYTLNLNKERKRATRPK